MFAINLAFSIGELYHAEISKYDSKIIQNAKCVDPIHSMCTIHLFFGHDSLYKACGSEKTDGKFKWKAIFPPLLPGTAFFMSCIATKIDIPLHHHLFIPHIHCVLS